MGGARGNKLRPRGDLHWARGDLAGNEAICLRVNLVLALVQLTRLWVLDLELDQAEQLTLVGHFDIHIRYRNI